MHAVKKDTHVYYYAVMKSHLYSPRMYFLNIFPFDCTSSSSASISLVPNNGEELYLKFENKNS